MTHEKPKSTLLRKGTNARAIVKVLRASGACERDVLLQKTGINPASLAKTVFRLNVLLEPHGWQVLVKSVGQWTYELVPLDNPAMSILEGLAED